MGRQGEIYETAKFLVMSHENMSLKSATNTPGDVEANIPCVSINVDIVRWFLQGF